MTKQKQPRYRYDKVICKRVIDADTIIVIIDLGFKIKHEKILRLARINAWEPKGKTKVKGKLATEYVKDKLFNVYLAEVPFRIETIKEEKYGRMLAEVFIGNKCLNDELVKEGHAVYQDY